MITTKLAKNKLQSYREHGIMTLGLKLSLPRTMAKDFFFQLCPDFLQTLLEAFTIMETSGKLTLKAEDGGWRNSNTTKRINDKHDLWLRNSADLPDTTNLDIAPGYRN